MRRILLRIFKVISCPFILFGNLDTRSPVQHLSMKETFCEKLVKTIGFGKDFNPLCLGAV